MGTRKYTIIQVLCVFGMLLFALIDFYLYKGGYFEKKMISLKYQENNEIDYKVYLKKNDFFESEYLEKGKTYITSLIDHINVDYKYNIQFDNLVDGEYRYYVYATVESNKANGEANYWSKDYNITDEKTGKIEHSGEFSIHENLNIDYNKYNSILNSFKKTLGLGSANGLLKVYLKVNSEVTGNTIETPIESKLLLQLPLSEMTIEASVDLDAHNNVKEVTKTIDYAKLKLLRSLGVIYIFAVIICFLILLIVTRKKRDLHLYENTLKKMLSTYDGIIVNVKKLPDLTNHQVIDVSSFEELLDAHGEVRMPINFYKDIDRSYFVLLNDKTAWKYTMKKRKYERK